MHDALFFLLLFTFWHLFLIYTLRIWAPINEANNISTIQINKKIKYFLFLYPLVNVQRFAFHTLICAAILQVTYLCQLVDLTVWYLGLDIDLKIDGKIFAVFRTLIYGGSFLLTIGYLFIKIIAVSVNESSIGKRSGESAELALSNKNTQTILKNNNKGALVSENDIGNNSFDVSPSMVFFLIDIAAILYCAVMIFLFRLGSVEWWFFGFLFLFCIIHITTSMPYETMYRISWKVKVNNNGIYHKSLFKHPVKIAFSDISKVEIRQLTNIDVSTIYYGTKELLKVDSSYRNYFLLLRRLELEKVKIVKTIPGGT